VQEKSLTHLFLPFFMQLLALILGMIIPITSRKWQNMAKLLTYLTQGVACEY
jgi:hypothetical protein